MGTSYFAVKTKPSIYNKPLHIGKSSGGWKFLFHGYTDERHITSIDDWKNYLKDNNMTILNEYDEVVSYEDFFKMVERKQQEENSDNFKNCVNIGGYRFAFSHFE